MTGINALTPTQERGMIRTFFLSQESGAENPKPRRSSRRNSDGEIEAKIFQLAGNLGFRTLRRIRIQENVSMEIGYAFLAVKQGRFRPSWRQRSLELFYLNEAMELLWRQALDGMENNARLSLTLDADGMIVVSADSRSPDRESRYLLTMKFSKRGVMRMRQRERLPDRPVRQLLKRFKQCFGFGRNNP